MICKKCVVQRQNAQNAERRAQNALQNPEPSPEPWGDDVETEVVVAQRDFDGLGHGLGVCHQIEFSVVEDLPKPLATQLVKRDVEVTQLRTQVAQLRTQLAAFRFRFRFRSQDIQIQELKDTQRDLEQQLDEQIDNFDDKAHAITVGASIMIENQFTQTQQN